MKRIKMAYEMNERSLSTSQASPDQSDRITQEQAARWRLVCCEAVLKMVAVRVQDHGVPALAARGNSDVREAFRIMLSTPMRNGSFRRLMLLSITPQLYRCRPSFRMRGCDGGRRGLRQRCCPVPSAMLKGHDEVLC